MPQSWPLFAEFDLRTGILLGGLAIVVCLLMLKSNRFFARQREARDTLARAAKPSADRRGQPLGGPDELLQWDVRMHETARQLAAELDSKASVLRALAIEADRAAARLEAALSAAAGALPAGTLPADRGTASPPPDPPAAAAEPLPATADHKQEIYTLADYGYSPAEIARRTGIPAGEVELTLRMR
jgi:hypothetical protein